MSHLFEAIDFVENPLYEKIISDIARQQFSISDDFFSLEEVFGKRGILQLKYCKTWL